MSVSLTYSFDSQSLSIERALRDFSIRGFLSKFFERLLSNYLSKLEGFLDSLYVDIQGSIVVANQFSTEDALRDLPSVKKTIRAFVKLKTRMEKVDYFESPSLKQKVDNVLSAMYEVEFLLKKKAYSDNRNLSKSSEFVQALSDISKKAITQSLAS